MKLWINVIIFIFVLCIPFALSSQTRKGYPPGRYEALSGIKVSRSNKNDNGNSNTSVNFWNEVIKNIPENKNELKYAYSNIKKFSLDQLIPNKRLVESKKIDQNLDLIVTNKLADKDHTKLKSKALVVMITNLAVQDLIEQYPDFELITFISSNNENYYLLKTK